MKFSNIIVFLFVLINIGNAVDINAIALSVNGGGNFYGSMVDDFNRYSKNNNLDITLNLNLLSFSNATSTVTDYESELKDLFQRKSKKYDIIFYDNIYSQRFGSYLVDLKNILPKNHIDMYMNEITSQTCFYNKKLIGIPITIDFSVIYYNEYLLNKYNQEVPKTWDQLIKTGKYIYEEELKRNNLNIIPYNGMFSEKEIGTCSLYEFIYSFRDLVQSPFPEITSQNAIDALKKIKEIKNEISTDELFKTDEGYAYGQIIANNYIFIKFWYIPELLEVSKVIPLPGWKEGVSGSIIGGYNVGINTYSDIKKRNSTIQAIVYLTSKDIQKKYFINNNYFSPIISVYDEEEMCSKINCSFFKSIQLISRPIMKSTNYNSYSEKFQKYIYTYIYGNDTAEHALKKVDDITKIYYISIKTDETVVGLILFIITIVLIAMILGSSIFLYLKKFKPFLTFLPNDFWYILIFGLVLTLCNILTELGKVSVLKCHLKVFILSISSSLYIIPILYKLMVNFPEKDFILSEWIKAHRYIYLFIYVIIDIVTNGLLIAAPFSVKNVINEGGQNYQTCEIGNFFGNLMIGSIVLTKALIIFQLAFLIFIEWNIINLHNYLRMLTVIIYVNCLIFVELVIIHLVHIRNYTFYYVIKESSYMFLVVANYFLIYGYRVLLPARKRDEKAELFDKAVNYLFSYDIKKSTLMFNDNEITNSELILSSPSSPSHRNPNSNSTFLSTMSQKMVDYHYTRSINQQEPINNDIFITIQKLQENNIL